MTSHSDEEFAAAVQAEIEIPGSPPAPESLSETLSESAAESVSVSQESAPVGVARRKYLPYSHLERRKQSTARLEKLDHASLLQDAWGHLRDGIEHFCENPAVQKAAEACVKEVAEGLVEDIAEHAFTSIFGLGSPLTNALEEGERSAAGPVVHPTNLGPAKPVVPEEKPVIPATPEVGLPPVDLRSKLVAPLPFDQGQEGLSFIVSSAPHFSED